MSNSESVPEPSSTEKGLKPFLKQIYHIWITERPAQFAAALAYYAIFSFVPVIYLAFSIADKLFQQLSVADQLYALIGDVLGTEVALSLQEAVASMGARTTGGTTLSTIIGLLALAFAASLTFFQLQFTLNTIWQVPRPSRDGTRSYIRGRLLAFAMVLGVVLFLIVVAALNVVVSFLNSLIGWGGAVSFINLLALVGLATVSFALLYKVLPNARVAWRDVWLGAGVAALLIGAGMYVVKFYLSASKFSSAMEAAGAVAVLLMTFYYAGQIFIIGALITRVYASMYGSRIVPRVADTPPPAEAQEEAAASAAEAAIASPLRDHSEGDQAANDDGR
jgi:membrane protein